MNYRTVTTLKSWINSGLLEHLTVTGISRHIELLMGSTDYVKHGNIKRSLDQADIRNF